MLNDFERLIAKHGPLVIHAAAEFLHVSPRTIRMWRTGVTNPSAEKGLPLEEYSHSLRYRPTP